MLLFFRFIAAIFPFVREMLFPGKSTKEILKENKLSVALAIMLALSGSFNYYMVKRVYEIAMERKSERDARTAAAGKASDPPATAASVAASAVAPAASTDDPDKKSQDELRDRLNGIFGK